MKQFSTVCFFYFSHFIIIFNMPVCTFPCSIGCTFICSLFAFLLPVHRSELEQLALERQHSEETVKSLRARCSEMEEQCVQHGRMHQRMKDRCGNFTQNVLTITQAESKVCAKASFHILTQSCSHLLRVFF